jgi:hypothetical protein
LNEVAFANVAIISRTFPTSQHERSLLNEQAPANIEHMFTTFDTHQGEISALKSSRPQNNKLMIVTREVSHDAMGPYLAFAAAGSSNHAFTAVLIPPSWSGFLWDSGKDSSLITYPCTAGGSSDGYDGAVVRQVRREARSTAQAAWYPHLQ